MTLHSTEISQVEELEKLQEFLKNNNLPHRDLILAGNIFITYHDQDGTLIGSGGIESYDSFALLRSVAVRADARGQKLGDHIVSDLLRRARQLDFKAVFLLTETARDFFVKKGFADISRDEVPDAVKSSSEFSFVCPVSASCMAFKFQADPVLA